MRSTTLITGLVLLGACGDDAQTMIDAAVQIDSRMIDAPPDAAVFKEFEADEGGEVRVEYVKLPNGNVVTRATAFWYKDAGATKYFDFVNTNGCTDVTQRPNVTNWPLAQNQTGRTYFDIGPSVTVIGGPTPYTIPKNTAGTPARDPFFRAHGANEWYFENFAGTDNDGATHFTPSTNYDVVLGGSSEFPATIYDNALHMPQDFDLTSPGHVGPVVMPAATDATFTWEVATESPPAGVTIMSLVGFTGAMGPAVVCVEPNDGSVTVPAAMVDKVYEMYPTGASLARQTFAHQVRELVDANGPTGRRVDLIGVWCYAGTNVVPL